MEPTNTRTILVIVFAGMFDLGFVPNVAAGEHERGELRPNAIAPNSLTSSHHCSPIGITRTDYFVETTSTLPHYSGLPASIWVHQVSPVYRHPQQCPHRPAVFPNTSGVDSVASFDLQFQDYSAQEALAWAGFDTFAVDLLGWGWSDRFVVDDPCASSPINQQNYLIPNPLSAECPDPDPFVFTHTYAMRDQFDAVIQDIRNRLGVSQVTLVGWSLGVGIVGDYVRTFPANVKDMVLLAGGHVGTNPPNPLPLPGHPIGVLFSRDTYFTNRWGSQLSNACPGERDPAILDPVWDAIRTSDPLASNWGPTDPLTGQPGGLLRGPSTSIWGWSLETVPEVTVPVLFVSGLSDNIVPTQQVLDVYNSIGSPTKVMVKIECASHFLLWESSASPTWQGPHATFQDALLQWINSETYQGVTQGIFQVDKDGNITGPF